MLDLSGKMPDEDEWVEKLRARRKNLADSYAVSPDGEIVIVRDGHLREFSTGGFYLESIVASGIPTDAHEHIAQVLESHGYKPGTRVRYQLCIRPVADDDSSD